MFLAVWSPQRDLYISMVVLALSLTHLSMLYPNSTLPYPPYPILCSPPLAAPIGRGVCHCRPAPPAGQTVVQQRFWKSCSMTELSANVDTSPRSRSLLAILRSTRRIILPEGEGGQGER